MRTDSGPYFMDDDDTIFGPGHKNAEELTSKLLGQLDEIKSTLVELMNLAFEEGASARLDCIDTEENA